MRVKQEFEDGEQCTVLLKDRSKKQTDNERLWYERAFGDKKNLMKVRFQFAPQKNLSEAEYFTQFAFNMFKEMEDEFNRAEWPANQTLRLEQEFEYDEEDEDSEKRVYKNIWSTELILPYGAIDAKLKFRPVDNHDAEDPNELLDPQGGNEKFFEVMYEPKPISADEQHALDNAEEEANKKREHDARLAQKKLEEEKARIRVE